MRVRACAIPGLKIQTGGTHFLWRVKVAESRSRFDFDRPLWRTISAQGRLSAPPECASLVTTPVWVGALMVDRAAWWLRK